jgi:hypothetical protein
MQLLLPLCLLTVGLSVPAEAQIGKIVDTIRGRAGTSDAKTASGLKEALGIGTDHAVDLTGRVDGFLKNAAIRILIPEKVRNMERGLRMMGLGPKLDEFEVSMNRAAEKAAPAAREIFKEALRQMTFDDVRKILTGGSTAATDYFKAKTSQRLVSSFQPMVRSAMDETGVVKQYRQLTGVLQAVPLARFQPPDITEYVVGKTVDGIFYMIAQEEIKIRTDPMAQITPLLREVFGKR